MILISRNYWDIGTLWKALASADSIRYNSLQLLIDFLSVSTSFPLISQDILIAIVADIEKAFFEKNLKIIPLLLKERILLHVTIELNLIPRLIAKTIPNQESYSNRLLKITKI